MYVQLFCDHSATISAPAFMCTCDLLPRALTAAAADLACEGLPDAMCTVGELFNEGVFV